MPSVFDRLYVTETESSSKKKQSNRTSVGTPFSKTLRQDNVVGATPDKRNLFARTKSTPTLANRNVPNAVKTPTSLTKTTSLFSNKFEVDSFNPITTLNGLSTAISEHQQGTAESLAFHSPTEMTLLNSSTTDELDSSFDRLYSTETESSRQKKQLFNKSEVDSVSPTTLKSLSTVISDYGQGNLSAESLAVRSPTKTTLHYSSTSSEMDSSLFDRLYSTETASSRQKKQSNRTSVGTPFSKTLRQDNVVGTAPDKRSPFPRKKSTPTPLKIDVPKAVKTTPTSQTKPTLLLSKSEANSFSPIVLKGISTVISKYEQDTLLPESLAVRSSPTKTTLLYNSTSDELDSFSPITLPGLSTAISEYEQGTLSAKSVAGRIIEALFYRDYSGCNSENPIQVTQVDAGVFDVSQESNCQDSVAYSAKARIRFGTHEVRIEDGTYEIRIEGYSYCVVAVVAG